VLRNPNTTSPMSLFNSHNASSNHPQLVLTPGNSTPAAPVLSAAASSSSQINLTWDDPHTDETGYKVQRSTSSTFSSGVTEFTLPANATGYSATGLSANTTYYFRVAAVKGTTVQTFSNTASATTQPQSGTGVTLSATADAHVRDGTHAGTNFGTAAEVEVKKGSSGFNREAYLKFDLTNVTAEQIGTAKLRLFGKLGAGGTNVATAVYGSTNSTWTESGLTWNTKPAATTSALATTTVTDQTGRFYEWNVTSFLKAEKAAGRNVVTLILKNPSTSNPLSLFATRNAASNTPQLLITPPTSNPGATTVKVGDDAHVRDGTHAGTNFGSATSMEVKKSTTSYTREAYLKFDLSGVSTISNAKFRVFAKLGVAGDPVNTSVFGAGGASWAESTIKWSNKPATTTAALGTKTISGTSSQWYEYDLTAYLQAEKAAGRNSVTLVLKNAATTNPQVVVASGETAQGAELVITA
jgi:hypothetical protein